MARIARVAPRLSMSLRQGARPVSTKGSDSSTGPGWSSSGVTTSERVRSTTSPL